MGNKIESRKQREDRALENARIQRVTCQEEAVEGIDQEQEQELVHNKEQKLLCEPSLLETNAEGYTNLEREFVNSIAIGYTSQELNRDVAFSLSADRIFELTKEGIGRWNTPVDPPSEKR